MRASAFLKPGGTIIPAAVEQFACPVVGERLYRDLAAWDEVGYGLDFAPAKAMSLNNIYVRWLEPADLLDGGAAAKAWDQVRFDRKNKTTRTGEVEMEASARPPPSTAWRCGGRPTSPRACALDRAARPAHALGAALPAGAGADQRWRQALRARLSPRRPSSGHQRDWTLSVADKGARAAARPSTWRGLPAVRRIRPGSFDASRAACQRRRSSDLRRKDLGSGS